MIEKKKNRKKDEDFKDNTCTSYQLVYTVNLPKVGTVPFNAIAFARGVDRLTCSTRN